MVLAVIGLVCVVCTLSLVYLELWRLRQSQIVRHFPGPKEYPIIGHLWVVCNNKLIDLQKIMEKICVTSVTKLMLCGKIVLVVSDPPLLQRILTSPICLERPFPFRFLDLGVGLITARYDKWKIMRKALNPSFNPKLLQKFIPIFERQYKGLTEELVSKIGGSDFDLNEIVKNISLNTIAETSCKIQKMDSKLFGRDSIDEMLDIASSRMINSLLYPNPIFKSTPMYKKQMSIKENCFKIVDEAIKKYQLSFQNQPKDDTLDDHRPKIFSEQLAKVKLEDGRSLTEQEILEQILTIIFAGYETTAFTVSSAILLLAMHPEVETKLLVELNENYTKDQPIDMDLLRRLPYLEQVIKETLRLIPTVPATGRETLASFDIGSCEVPKGTFFVLNFFKMHRDPAIWGSDALQFNPDRFSKENCAQRHTYAFLPFSSGSRNCIGNLYAMIAIRIALIHLLTNYRFETKLRLEELQVKFNITLKLMNKHLVTVKRR